MSIARKCKVVDCKSGLEAHGLCNKHYSAWYNSVNPLRRTYQNMKSRCNNSNDDNFQYYGGKGIKVCDRWSVSFLNFVEDMGERPEGHTLDRIDPHGNYSPENCRWADKTTQRRNTGMDKRNKSGVKGVYWNKLRSRWGAYISVDKKQFSLGHFTSVDDAIKARKEAEQRYWK